MRSCPLALLSSCALALLYHAQQTLRGLVLANERPAEGVYLCSESAGLCPSQLRLQARSGLHDALEPFLPGCWDTRRSSSCWFCTRSCTLAGITVLQRGNKQLQKLRLDGLCWPTSHRPPPDSQKNSKAHGCLKNAADRRHFANKSWTKVTPLAVIMIANVSCIVSQTSRAQVHPRWLTSRCMRLLAGASSYVSATSKASKCRLLV